MKAFVWMVPMLGTLPGTQPAFYGGLVNVADDAPYVEMPPHPLGEVAEVGAGFGLEPGAIKLDRWDVVGLKLHIDKHLLESYLNSPEFKLYQAEMDAHLLWGDDEERWPQHEEIVADVKRLREVIEAKEACRKAYGMKLEPKTTSDLAGLLLKATEPE